MKKLLLLFVLLPFAAMAQVINTVAGDGVRGYTGNGGPAVSAELFGPESVALDNSGNFYIADFENNCIRKVNSAGIITTIAGVDTAGYRGDGGPATAAELFGPSGVATDGAGNIYIADLYNNVIRKIDTAGIITTIAGDGYGAGSYSGGYSGDGGPATAAEFYGPSAVVFEGGNIYISDEGNNRVRKVNAAGTITTIAGNGLAGYTGDGGMADTTRLNSPVGIAFDDTGNLYIADEFNDRVRKVSVAGIISTIAGNGTAGYTGDGGMADTTMLNNPVGVGTDDSGNVYIADYDNNRIRKVTPAGIISTLAGDSVQGYNGDGGYADTSELFTPTGVVVAQDGDVYIADAGNARIRRIVFNYAITGPQTICTGDSITLSNPFSGGTWSSSNTLVATTDPGDGIVTGIAAGTASITYTIATSNYTIVVTVNASPDAINASSEWLWICDNIFPYTLALDDTTVGGLWSSIDTNIAMINSSGLVTLDPAWIGYGMGILYDTILYTMPNGCSVSTVVNIALCEGIPTIPNANEITIFPNPATSSLSIQSSNQPIANVRITNLLGQNVYLQTAPANCQLLTVDVSALPTGVYFAQVNGSEVKKFVKE